MLVLFFLVHFYPKTLRTIKKWGNFYNFFVFNIFFCRFWLIFYALDPDPWICMFLRFQIQEGKILRIQWIRILSTLLQIFKFLWWKTNCLKIKSLIFQSLCSGIYFIAPPPCIIVYLYIVMVANSIVLTVAVTLQGNNKWKPP